MYYFGKLCFTSVIWIYLAPLAECFILDESPLYPAAVSSPRDEGGLLPQTRCARWKSFLTVNISDQVQLLHKYKYKDAVVALDGTVVFAPRNANSVGIFDPKDRSFLAVDISDQVTGNYKYSGAVVTSDGTVVFVPWNADNVGLFIPKGQNFLAVDISDQLTVNGKYKGAVVASDGTVVFVPWNADSVGVFNPKDRSFLVVNISDKVAGWSKYIGAVATPDGTVVLAPFYAGSVGVFDPKDRSFLAVDISNQVTGVSKYYSGAVFAPDGTVVFAPKNADSVGIFDPKDRSFLAVDISDQVTGVSKYSGAVVALDGTVVFVPENADNVGVFHHKGQRFVAMNISDQVTSLSKCPSKYDGAVVAQDGTVVFVPGSADSVGVLNLTDIVPAALEILSNDSVCTRSRVVAAEALKTLSAFEALNSLRVIARRGFEDTELRERSALAYSIILASKVEKDLASAVAGEDEATLESEIAVAETAVFFAGDDLACSAKSKLRDLQDRGERRAYFRWVFGALALIGLIVILTVTVSCLPRWIEARAKAQRNAEDHEDYMRKVDAAVEAATCCHLESDFPLVAVSPCEMNAFSAHSEIYRNPDVLLEKGVLVDVMEPAFALIQDYVNMGKGVWDFDRVVGADQATAALCCEGFQFTRKHVNQHEAVDLEELGQLVAKLETHVKEYTSRLESMSRPMQKYEALYRQSIYCKKHVFDPLLERVAPEGTDLKLAGPKGLLRMFEKAALRPDGGLPWDSCRGMLVGLLRFLVEVLKRLLILAEAGELRIVAVNNRFQRPTKDGWQDISVYMMFPRVPECADVVSELQLVHPRFLDIRERFKAHDAYDKVRFAAELKMSVTHQESAGLPDSQREKGAQEPLPTTSTHFETFCKSFANVTAAKRVAKESSQQAVTSSPAGSAAAQSVDIEMPELSQARV